VIFNQQSSTQYPQQILSYVSYFKIYKYPRVVSEFNIYIMEIYYVYIYLNPLKSGKFDFGLDFSFLYEPFYVGKGHLDRCEYGMKYSNFTSNLHKKNTIKKIIESGQQPIIVKIHENLLEDKAFELETFFISKIGRRDMKTGPLVNLTDGGEGRRDRSLGRLELMSKPVLQFQNEKLVAEFKSIKDAISTTGIITIGRAASGRYKTAGGFRWVYKYSEDILQGHLKSPIKGRPHTEETKNKLRKKRSEITKQRLSMSQQNKKNVYQYNTNLDLIRVWNSISSIEREFGYLRASIRRCCNGKSKKSYNYIWSWYLL
jgi:hypothetical protein